MVKLYREDVLDFPLDKWQREAFLDFDEKITHKTFRFPCIPAYQGYKLNQLRFGFADDPRKEKAALELANLLEAYGATSKDMGVYTALIVFFKTPPDLKNLYNVYDFEQIFWKLLNRVNLFDKEEWIESISTNPDHSSWEYCFNRERYFMYCATPAHRNRKSRYFPTFMLAITPRWVLEEFSASQEKADRMKEMIRKRLVDYDEVPPHPELKWYGGPDNFEWKQYYLRDNDSTLPACPFKHVWKKQDE
ncbi:YqcI/YcgG family protein [Bacillus sp. FJAT-49736]|uniref:YqcI/YcgG family protein n=1 Tax=Bacillus sp. FJAT-49736 TaxID=2833582 RepID=UPI001BC8F49E|nr:YqcI/YcgG family protein [Bacillus sp. FJAT-49736]MBS4173064.1 YqcI/YcgG family protein [Bacillus sp. FJAT-49736]